MILRALLLLTCCVFLDASPKRRSFSIDYEHDTFLKDGEPFRYVSGGMHYFRVLPDQWDDRLSKLRKAGLNAVQTYVAWNMHEPEPGRYEFSGGNDLVRFIELAQKNDLLVILRPGPYICAEWEFGGLPYWLLKKKDLQIRTSADEKYMSIVDGWMKKLLTTIKPLLYANGGPIISVQVENEYGSYGCDHKYIELLRAMFIKYLVDDVVLFTTDGAGDGYLKCGAVEDIYTTVDFGAGGNPNNSFAYQRKWQKKGPLVNSEFYTGWLDHWGEAHSRVSASVVADTLDKMLAVGASVNMYMFEGGTNFGFMNGANGLYKIQPQPTSYDYDAPLTEAGDPTPKYFILQKVISKYLPLPSEHDPKPAPKAAYGKVMSHASIPFHYAINELYPSGAPFKSSKPQSFEQMNVSYGYVLYRTDIPASLKGDKVLLTLKKLRDRATILVDKVWQGTLDRNINTSISVANGKQLEIIVDNQGRVNYGGGMRDSLKGILCDVNFGGRILTEWEMFPFPGVKDDNKSIFSPEKALLIAQKYQQRSPASDPHLVTAPMVTVYWFTTDERKDTYLKLENWAKGFAVLNGFNLGRYWTTAGPQKTLYVPASLLVTTDENQGNVLVTFESDRAAKYDDRFVEFVDEPDLGSARFWGEKKNKPWFWN